MLSIFLGLLFAGFASGIPVAFAFIGVNLLAISIWGGGVEALAVPVFSALSMLTTFTLVPVPLFILMGEVLFHSGVVRLIIDSLDIWIGRLPGRLSLVAVSAGTLFGALSGSALGIVAVLGETLVPEMRRAGYSKEMSFGPIMGSGGLAMIIPPTALGVLLGALAEVSIARLLIACIVPGLLLAASYATYVGVRARLQPQLAPPYMEKPASLKERVLSLRHILPTGFIIFLVTGVIFLGMATPSEAAALGALGAFILAAAYRKLTPKVVWKALVGTVRVTVMIFMIVVGSVAFSEFLAYSGSTEGLIMLATKLPVSPLVVLIAMQIVLIILGMFIDEISMMMVSIPIYMPIINAFGFDPIWFCILVLINFEIGLLSPPFGLSLFIIKGMVPDATMGEIISSAIPFCLCDMLVMALIIAFPAIALWLPRLMA